MRISCVAAVPSNGSALWREKKLSAAAQLAR